jgi:hypothetical protein
MAGCHERDGDASGQEEQMSERQTTPAWNGFDRGMPPQNVEVELLSKAGMTTRGIHKGGKGWSDGIHCAPDAFTLYPGDYLVAWRTA